MSKQKAVRRSRAELDKAAWLERFAEVRNLRLWYSSSLRSYLLMHRHDDKWTAAHEFRAAGGRDIDAMLTEGVAEALARAERDRSPVSSSNVFLCSGGKHLFGCACEGQDWGKPVPASTEEPS